MTNFMHDLVDFLMGVGVPPILHVLFYLVNMFPAIFEKFSAFVCDCVYLLPILFQGAYVTHIFQQLQRRIDATRAWGIETVEPLFQRPYYFIAMIGLIFNQIQDDVLKVTFLE